MLAELNGTRLYYEASGSGDPLVLIHGNTLNSRMWDDQFEVFARHYRVVRYDARGFGKSALPTGESYSHADDLMSLLEHLGIPRAYVLGLSMGGRIATDFALAYPDATGALIPVDGGAGGQPAPAGAPTPVDSVYRAVYVTAKEKGMQAARELYMRDHPCLRRYGPERPDLVPRLAGMLAAYSGWHWVNDDPARAPDPPAVQRLEEIGAPTLIIVGELDVPGLLALADTMERRIPNARKVVLPGVGHMSNMEAPARFNETVLDFLSSIQD